MPAVLELVKDREQYYANVNDNVMNVVRYMVERHIGAVAVTNNGKLAGIFSERDLMRRVVAEGRDPKTLKVSEVMTRDPLTVRPDDSLDTAMELMKQHGFRHLPVCDGDQVSGLISMRDLLANAVLEKDGEVQMMRAYISGA
jgi:CBS domain-containing protein